MNEAKALGELKRGSEKALEWFMERYSAYVGTVVYNIIGGSRSREDVEEVCSDVFVTLWTSAGKIKGAGVKSYLVSVARNKSIDLLRKSGQELPLEDDVLIAEEPESVLSRREEAAAVRQAVLSMDWPDREIFLRHYYYCQKISDIAREMDMKEATVKTHLRRGREKLRFVLESKALA